MDIGSLRHQVRLETPTETADGDGGYTTTWALLDPPVVWAAIEPASQQRLERVVANAVSSDTSHIVTIRYHSGVTTKARVVFAGRTLSVVGVQNVQERNEILMLACVEKVT
uniref:Putative head-tail joining protein n=1 Tax=viral metagenome TaxID=1070528 RepID=A0A6M3J723_9ZZZZ